MTLHRELWAKTSHRLSEPAEFNRVEICYLVGSSWSTIWVEAGSDQDALALQEAHKCLDRLASAYPEAAKSITKLTRTCSQRVEMIPTMWNTE